MNNRYDRYKRYITKEEEIELYHKMRNGDDEAREELILAHSYLVIEISKRYSQYGPEDDIIQEGYIGLMKSVDKYDINKGSLRAYSSQRIKSQILRFLDKNRHIIKMPTPQVQQLLKLLRIRNKMEIELKRSPSYKELMNNPEVIDAYKLYSQNLTTTKFSLSEYVKLLELGNPVTSLNEPLAENSNSELMDIVEDPYQQKQFQKIEYEDIGNVVMDILDEQEKFILKSIRDGKTGQEIGGELGITTQTVSKIKLSSIRKIKHYVRNNPELKEILESSGFTI